MSGVALHETLPSVPAGRNPFSFYSEWIEAAVFPPTPRPRLKGRYIALFVLLFCDVCLFSFKLYITYRDGKGPVKSRLAIWRSVHDDVKKARVLIFSTLMPINCILSSLAILGVAGNYYSVFFGPSTKRVSLFWVGIPSLALFLTGALAIVCTAQAYILAKRRQSQEYWLRLDIFNNVCLGVAAATVFVAIPIIVNASVRWTTVWRAWLTVKDELAFAATTWPEQTVDDAFLRRFMPDYAALRSACHRYTKACRIFFIACIVLTFVLAILPAFIVPFVLLLRRSIETRRKLSSQELVPSDGTGHMTIVVEPTTPDTPAMSSPGLGTTPKVTPMSEVDMPFSFVSTLVARRKQREVDPQVSAIKRAEMELVTVALGVFAVSSGCLAVVLWNSTLSYQEYITAADVELRAILIPYLGSGSLFIGACVLLWARWDLHRETTRSANSSGTAVVGSEKLSDGAMNGGNAGTQLPQATSALLVKIAEANTFNEASTRVEERPLVAVIEDEEALLEHTRRARLIIVCFEALFKSVVREDHATGAAANVNEADLKAIRDALVPQLAQLRQVPAVWLLRLSSELANGQAAAGAPPKHDTRLFGQSFTTLAIKAMAMFDTTVALSERNKRYDVVGTLTSDTHDTLVSVISALAIYGSSLHLGPAKDTPEGGIGPALLALKSLLKLCDECLESLDGPYPVSIPLHFDAKQTELDPFDDAHASIVLRSPLHAHVTILRVVDIVADVLVRAKLAKSVENQLVATVMQSFETAFAISNAISSSTMSRLRRSYLEKAAFVATVCTDPNLAQSLCSLAATQATTVLLDSQQSHDEVEAATAALRRLAPMLKSARSASLLSLAATHRNRLFEVLQRRDCEPRVQLCCVLLLAGLGQSTITLDDEGFLVVIRAVARLFKDCEPIDLSFLREILIKLAKDGRVARRNDPKAGRKRSRNAMEAEDDMSSLVKLSLAHRMQDLAGEGALEIKDDLSPAETINQVLVALSQPKDDAVAKRLVRALAAALCSSTFEAAGSACLYCDRGLVSAPDPTGSKQSSSPELQAAQAEQVAIRLAPLYDNATDPELREAVLDLLTRLIEHCTRLSPGMEVNAKRLISKAMTSDIHETRQAAQRAFAVFCERIERDEPDERSSRIRVQAFFDEFRNISNSRPVVLVNFLYAVERALRSASPRGQVERACLLALALELAHSNDFVRHVARIQIDTAATVRDMRPFSFFRPHLPWLIPALTARTNGKCLQRLPSVFGQNLAAFNALTSAYSVPVFVRENNKRALDTIAASLDMGTAQMLIKNEAVDPVAATTLFSAYMETDDLVRSNCLRHLMQLVDPSVTMSSIHTTFRVLTLSMIAFELGDHDPNRVKQAQRALVNFEINCKANASPTVQSVLKDNAVGIMTFVNRVLNESAQLRLPSDREKAIRSLAKMVELAGGVLATYSAQINATLLGAIAHDSLRGTALKSLKDFMMASKYRQIGPFVAQTTATMVRLWPRFAAAERKTASELMLYIVKHAASDLKAFLRDIADMSDIEALASAQETLKELRRDWSFNAKVTHLLRRMSGDNVMVVHQAVDELRKQLSAHEKRLRTLTKGDAFDELVGRVVQTLFSVAAKEGPDFQGVREAAYGCIGLLGAVDPDRVTMPAAPARFILLHNFDDKEETINFALHLLKDYLVKSYQGSTDTKQQGALAYVIHCLLAFCGFDESLVQARQSSGISRAVVQRWESLPDSVVSVCTPLLGVYLSVAYKAETAKSQPIYTSTHEYRDWIRIWVHHLMSKMTKPAVRDFFDIFGPVLNMDDTSLAQALLPHAVLYVLISGDLQAALEACQEVRAVLADQVNPAGHTMSETNRLLAAETIFALMDHLSQWLTQARQLVAQSKSKKRSESSTRRAAPSDLVEAMRRVDEVFKSIPHIMIGQAALNCKAYARSLLNFEQHIKLHPKKSASVQECYESLHECYANLDEPDGMEGVSPEILTPSLRQQIREHESTGRWTSAHSCWELRLQQDSNDSANHLGLLRCLQSLGHYDSMRIHIAGVLAEHSEDQAWRTALAPYQVEAAMNTGDWAVIEEVMHLTDATGPSIAFGKVVTAVNSGFDVPEAFSQARRMVGEPIGATGKESYRRVYDATTYLHMLHDFEYIYKHLSSSRQLLEPRHLELLASRLDATSPAFRTQELILNMQRNSLRAMKGYSPDRNENTHIGILWLETSRIARKARHRQTAYSAVLQAHEMNNPWAFVEEAKLSRLGNDLNKAVRIMAHGISVNREQAAPGPYIQTKDKGSTIARGWLSQTRWQHAAGRLDKNQIVSQYSEATKLSQSWESPYYHLGHFHDSLTVPLEKKRGSQLTEALQRRELTIEAFSNSLAYGTKYLYQALPRMLTLWLELGDNADVIRAGKLKKQNKEKEMDALTSELWVSFVRINRRIEKNVKNLPSYLWLAVLPQIVSRIVHKNDYLYRTLEKILLRVMTTYPHQAFWGMAAGPKSTVAQRSKRSLYIFDKAKNDTTDPVMSKRLPQIINEGLALVDQLLNVCEHPISKSDTLSLRKTFPNLDRLAPLCIAIPTLEALTVSLPFDAIHSADHKPFPETVVSFASFDDAVKIMSSLQRPRKITVIGTDGNEYGFLCKPKDDLRKDARLMEFNSMINKLLKKDSDSRQRKLKIRTYQVVPLNEECGFIEWVPNVLVLRPIFNDYYTAQNIPYWNSELKRTFESIRDRPQQAASIFEKQILSKFPPVFHQWFLDTFPDPSAWLQARMNYSRTCAVMSMTGFVLGLGDRHTENILVDGRTGDTVHVDFNCLFDKGRTLDIPERVPFRLTQNIIDGMGVTGVEGVYRKSCETSLRILRTNKDSLMSVLETFLHDPLYEWTSKRKHRNSAADDENALGREARRSLDPISWKLRGVQVTSDPESRGEKEVSIGEQVERLIREAVSPQNLGAMYVGWAPHY